MFDQTNITTTISATIVRARPPTSIGNKVLAASEGDPLPPPEWPFALSLSELIIVCILMRNRESLSMFSLVGTRLPLLAKLPEGRPGQWPHDPVSSCKLGFHLAHATNLFSRCNRALNFRHLLGSSFRRTAQACPASRHAASASSAAAKASRLDIRRSVSPAGAVV